MAGGSIPNRTNVSDKPNRPQVLISRKSDMFVLRPTLAIHPTCMISPGLCKEGKGLGFAMRFRRSAGVDSSISLSQPVRPVVKEDRMKRARWIAIVSTMILAFAAFFISNTVLALLPTAPNGIRPPCFPVFEVPFTDHFFRLPLWMPHHPL